MKGKMKILLILMVTILLLFSSTYITVFASTPDSDFMEQGKSWLELAKKEGKADSRGNWKGFNDLAGVLWGIGIFVVVICGTILGIKYMFASLEERASIKESIKPYIIGTVIILGALSIWKFSVEFLETI